MEPSVKRIKLHNDQDSGLNALAEATVLASRDQFEAQNANETGTAPKISRDATLIICGMRGAGKTTFGLIASTYLNRPLIDTDRVFEKLFNTSIKNYVKEHGWDAFRPQETAILKDVLKRYPTGAVIVLGGGVVDRQENVDFLKSLSRSGKSVVIHVRRQMEDVFSYLQKLHSSRTTWHNLGEGYREIWERRSVRLEECSDFTFVSLTVNPQPGTTVHQSLSLKHVEKSLHLFLRDLLGIKTYFPSPPPLKITWKTPRTTSLCIHESDPVINNAPILKEICQSADVITLCIESPKIPKGQVLPYNDEEQVAQICLRTARLTQYSARPIQYMPLIPNHDVYSVEPYIQKVHLGLKLACSFVEISLNLSDSQIKNILKRKRSSHTSIILSSFIPNSNSRSSPSSSSSSPSPSTSSSFPLSWFSDVVQEYYNRAVRLGADIVRLYKNAAYITDSFDALTLQARMASDPTTSKVPLSAITLGQRGKMSRYFDPILTPTTDHRLSWPTAKIALASLPSEIDSTYNNNNNHNSTTNNHNNNNNNNNGIDDSDKVNSETSVYSTNGLDGSNNSIITGGNCSVFSFRELQTALSMAGINSKRKIYELHIGPDDPRPVPIDITAMMRTGIDVLKIPFSTSYWVDTPLQDLVSQKDFAGALINFELPRSRKRKLFASNYLQERVSCCARKVGYADLVIRHYDDSPLRPFQVGSRGKVNDNIIFAEDDEDEDEDSDTMLVFENLHPLAMSRCISNNLSPVNAIGPRTSAIVVGASGRLGREILYSLKSSGVRKVFAVQCGSDIRLFDDDNHDTNKNSKKNKGTIYDNNFSTSSSASSGIDVEDGDQYPTTTAEDNNNTTDADTDTNTKRIGAAAQAALDEGTKRYHTWYPESDPNFQTEIIELDDLSQLDIPNNPNFSSNLPPSILVLCPKTDYRPGHPSVPSTSPSSSLSPSSPLNANINIKSSHANSEEPTPPLPPPPHPSSVPSTNPPPPPAFSIPLSSTNSQTEQQQQNDPEQLDHNTLPDNDGYGIRFPRLLTDSSTGGVVINLTSSQLPYELTSAWTVITVRDLAIELGKLFFRRITRKRLPEAVAALC